MPRSLSSAHSQRWAQAWSDRAEIAAHLLTGDAHDLSAGADPLLVAGALRAVEGGRVHFAQAGEADRIRLLLGPLRRPAWREMPGATWAWVLLDERTPPVVVRCAGWMGLCVDGAWVGWKRGAMDLRTELPPGLHRVVLVDL